MESGWNVWMCLVGMVSRRWVWKLTRGRSAFCLLETRRFLTLGVDTEIVTRFITRNALT